MNDEKQKNGNTSVHATPCAGSFATEMCCVTVRIFHWRKKTGSMLRKDYRNSLMM
jgi:hypothetical protein